MKALERLTRARSVLILDHCFWGVLSLKLKLNEADYVPTLATNGDAVLFNPDFVKKLTNQELVGVMAHEVGHCALGHCWRGGHRDPAVANMAMDYVLNGELVKAGFTLPEGALIDNQFTGMSFEEAYNILIQRMGQQSKGQGKGQGKPDKYADPGGCGNCFQGKTEGEDDANTSTPEEKEADWKASVANAAQMAKGQGDVPANFRKMIEEVIDPPLPWNVLLANFVERTARNDYNWNNPNRRYLNRGFVLPGLLSDELQRVVVANDTSGSTAGVQGYFCNEISAILAMFKTTITVIECDAKVQQVKDYESDDLPIEFNIKGYGGTDFRPVFDHVEKEGLMPSCLIYLTDTYGSFPTEPPDYPVMWVSVEKAGKCPWGEVVYLDPKTATVGV